MECVLFLNSGREKSKIGGGDVQVALRDCFAAIHKLK